MGHRNALGYSEYRYESNGYVKNNAIAFLGVFLGLTMVELLRPSPFPASPGRPGNPAKPAMSGPSARS